MWILYAFGSAIFAGITAILAKAVSKTQILMLQRQFVRELY